MESKSALRQEIAAMLRATDQPMTAGDVYERSELAIDRKQSTKTIANMAAAGEVEKLPPAEGERHSRYQMPQVGTQTKPGSDHPWRCPTSLKQRTAANRAKTVGLPPPALENQPGTRAEPKTQTTAVTEEEMANAVADLDAKNAVEDARDRTTPEEVRFGLFSDGAIEIFARGHYIKMLPGTAAALMDWLLDMAPAIDNLRSHGAIK